MLLAADCCAHQRRRARTRCRSNCCNCSMSILAPFSHLCLASGPDISAASACCLCHHGCAHSLSIHLRFLAITPFSPPPPLGRTRTLCPSLFLPLHTVCTNAPGTTVSELLRSLTAVLKTSAAATDGEASDLGGEVCVSVSLPAAEAVTAEQSHPKSTESGYLEACEAHRQSRRA